MSSRSEPGWTENSMFTNVIAPKPGRLKDNSMFINVISLLHHLDRGKNSMFTIVISPKPGRLRKTRCLSMSSRSEPRLDGNSMFTNVIRNPPHPENSMFTNVWESPTPPPPGARPRTFGLELSSLRR
jgi:hypothetical protein